MARAEHLVDLQGVGDRAGDLAGRAAESDQGMVARVEAAGG
jgi:hypothetical protein